MRQQIVPQGVSRFVQAFQIGEKAALVRAAEGIQLIGEGRGAGDGQVIRPADPPALTQLQQTQDGLVGILAVVQQRGVERQIIGGPAGHQNFSVAVGDVAPGGLHRLRPGNAADGAGVISFVIVDLGVIQDAQKHRHHGEEQACQDIQAKVAGLLLIHGYSFLVVQMGPAEHGGKQQHHRDDQQDGDADLLCEKAGAGSPGVLPPGPQQKAVE